MENSAILLTAASLGFIHTVLGPDHYIPFVALSKARNWSKNKTALVTFLCGLGHVASSVLIGLAGIAMGTAVSRLEWVEGLRGDAAGWLLLSFGLAYMAWGVKKALKGEKHSHLHSHGEGPEHSHGHDHEAAHTHPHGEKGSVTPWALFIVFIFGPCEPLIPVLIYPALKTGMGLALAAAAVFSAVTITTMMASVFLLLRGIRLFPVERMERYAHALAGLAIFVCGVAVKAGL
jgi:sulfite exporter TauE/SafE